MQRAAESSNILFKTLQNKISVNLIIQPFFLIWIISIITFLFKKKKKVIVLNLLPLNSEKIMFHSQKACLLKKENRANLGFSGYLFILICNNEHYFDSRFYTICNKIGVTITRRKRRRKKV